MATIQEIGEMKAHAWGFPNDHALIERIKMIVVPMWATIVQRRLDQTHRYPTALIQTLTCRDLIRDECSGILLKRTREKIPSPIIIRDRSEFTFVGERRDFLPFSRIQFSDIQFQKYKKFTATTPYYFYFDNYVWVGNVPHLKQLMIAGIFDNPVELARLGDVDGDCFDDGEFVIVHQSLLQPVLQLIENERPKLITPHLDTEVDINEK